MDFGLGRWDWEDGRDAEFPMSGAVGRALVPRRFRSWPVPVAMDQGTLPHCVAFAWKGLLMASPWEQGHGADTGQVYDWCQRNDEWPGEGYDGTSVRAGAKWAQRNGFVERYVWAEGSEDVKRWILRRGPVVLGTSWWSGMSGLEAWTREPYVAKPRGSLQGGHAYLAFGYESFRNLGIGWGGNAFLCLNSWGLNWGRSGVFLLWERDLDWLVRNHGEACAPVEVLRP